MLRDEDHDDPAAAVAASPVDQPGDTTLRKGVFRLWQGLAEAMQAIPSDTKGSDLASADQPLINRPHRKEINPYINPSISHLNQPFLSALLRNPVR